MYLIHLNEHLNKIEPFGLPSLLHSQQNMSYSNDLNVGASYLYSLDIVENIESLFKHSIHSHAQQAPSYSNDSHEGRVILQV